MVPCVKQAAGRTPLVFVFVSAAAPHAALPRFTLVLGAYYYYFCYETSTVYARPVKKIVPGGLL